MSKTEHDYLDKTWMAIVVFKKQNNNKKPNAYT